mmetsp:Transcript_18835/g.23097  ORF Transcript_18835/g.23097 Transcript_18835/m.23097 type:complete len:121 (-) Transcript_18835:53-415(-)
MHTLLCYDMLAGRKSQIQKKISGSPLTIVLIVYPLRLKSEATRTLRKRKSTPPSAATLNTFHCLFGVLPMATFHGLSWPLSLLVCFLTGCFQLLFQNKNVQGETELIEKNTVLICFLDQK